MSGRKAKLMTHPLFIMSAPKAHYPLFNLVEKNAMPAIGWNSGEKNRSPASRVGRVQFKRPACKLPARAWPQVLEEEEEEFWEEAEIFKEGIDLKRFSFHDGIGSGSRYLSGRSSGKFDRDSLERTAAEIIVALQKTEAEIRKLEQIALAESRLQISRAGDWRGEAVREEDFLSVEEVSWEDVMASSFSELMQGKPELQTCVMEEVGSVEKIVRARRASLSLDESRSGKVFCMEEKAGGDVVSEAAAPCGFITLQESELRAVNRRLSEQVCGAFLPDCDSSAGSESKEDRAFSPDGVRRLSWCAKGGGAEFAQRDTTLVQVRGDGGATRCTGVRDGPARSETCLRRDRQTQCESGSPETAFGSDKAESSHARVGASRSPLSSEPCSPGRFSGSWSGLMRDAARRASPVRSGVRMKVKLRLISPFQLLRKFKEVCARLIFASVKPDSVAEAGHGMPGRPSTSSNSSFTSNGRMSGSYSSGQYTSSPSHRKSSVGKSTRSSPYTCSPTISKHAFYAEAISDCIDFIKRSSTPDPRLV